MTEPDLSSSSLGARFIRGTVWSLIGTAIAQGLAMAASIVTARLLGKVGFGELGIINNTIGAFGILAGMGLGLTVTKYLAELRVSDPDRAGRILGLSNRIAAISGALFAGAFWGMAPWLASEMLNAPHLVNELRLGCFLLFLNTLIGLQTGALAGLEAFKAIAQVSFARGLLSFPLMIGGVWLFGLAGAVGATVVLSAIGWGLNYAALQRACAQAGISSQSRGLRMELPILWSFALPALLSGVLYGPPQWLANTILVNQPGGYSEMGLLSVTNQWRTALLMLPSIFLQVSLPLMASQVGLETDGHSRVLVLTHDLTTIVIFPLGTLLMFLSDWVMRLYGSGFVDGAVVLIGITSGVMMQAIGNPSGAAIQAKGKMWLGLALNLIWGTILVLFVWLTAFRLGANSIAVGLVLGYLVLTLWGFKYLESDLPKGLLGRIVREIGFVLALTGISVSQTAESRTLMAIPAVVISLGITWFALVDAQFRDRALSLMRRQIEGKGAA